jgi:acetoin utilization protein AcuB
MIVSMWMTRDIVTVGPGTAITEAAELMALKRIRRLPVVESPAAGQKLVGIVSAKDILHAFPPDVNPFAALGPAARPNAATIAAIMSRYLHTTTPDAPIEEAAGLMAGKKIGSLPVVRDGRLVGLITESDIFRAFVSFFATPQRGARITFDLSQGEDVFDWLSREARRRKLRVVSLITSQQDNVPVCVVRVAGDGTEPLLDDLWNSGHRVLNVIRVTGESTETAPP